MVHTGLAVGSMCPTVDDLPTVRESSPPAVCPETIRSGADRCHGRVWFGWWRQAATANADDEDGYERLQSDRD